jgi:hypothetical protein
LFDGDDSFFRTHSDQVLVYAGDSNGEIHLGRQRAGAADFPLVRIYPVQAKMKRNDGSVSL